MLSSKLEDRLPYRTTDALDPGLVNVDANGPENVLENVVGSKKKRTFATKKLYAWQKLSASKNKTVVATKKLVVNNKSINNVLNACSMKSKAIFKNNRIKCKNLRDSS